MNEHFSDRRKIDPTRGALLGDGTPNDANRVEIGPTRLAFAEWAEAGLDLPDLSRMRRYRWQRLVDELQARDYGALLVFDPLNIRYATDTTNMQLWNSHNPFRAVLLCADGYMVIFDYKNAPFLSEFNPLVREVRSGAGFFYFVTGDRSPDAARDFAGQISEIIAEHAPGNRRIAVDKILVHGLRALEAAGFDVMEGEEVTERARAIKGPDEISAMRCAMHACETSMKITEDFTRETVPGGEVSEDDIWAMLNAESIRRGGEWIETRLLASGPRTNPWFQECGPRLVNNNEIVAFDTDLIGCYGICIDISRTWWIGDRPARPDMIDAMCHALDHIETNARLLTPGTHFSELTFGGHQLDPRYEARQYSCRFHGVGLCDEWPLIAYPADYVEGAFVDVVRPGMVFCVEALVGDEGGDFCIKLEDQILVTETGPENLTSYPFDPRLTGAR